MRILLICKETFSIPQLFLAEKLAALGHQPALFFVYPEECMTPRCRYNDVTYYKAKERCPYPVYDVSDIGLELLARYDLATADEKIMAEIEKRYTYYKPLNLQLISSQPNSRSFHYRNKFGYSDMAQNALWLQLCYQKVESVLDDFAPDFIFDLDTAELIRTVLNEVSRVREIPYVSVEFPRFEDYKIPSFNLGLDVDNYFKERFSADLLLDADELQDEYAYIRSFREQSSIMAQQYIGTPTATYDPSPFADSLKTMFRVGKTNIGISLARRKLESRKRIKGCAIATSTVRSFGDTASAEFVKQLLFRRNGFFHDPRPGEKYVYMPLHLIPESTTSVKAPYYIEELHTIKQVSKSLPIDWVLYVKEHQSMLGERPLAFYKEVNKLPNAKMVSLNYYKDPKPWIENCIGVVTVTGTSAYEAALLGKKALVFGSAPFNVLPSVTRVTSFSDLGKHLVQLASAIDAEENEKACAAYIKAVEEVGVPLRLSRLVERCYDFLEYDREFDSELESDLQQLLAFFLKAVAIYDKRLDV